MTTRSGLIYNSSSVSASCASASASSVSASCQTRRPARACTIKPTIKSASKVNQKQKPMLTRSARTAFTAEYIREYCDSSDNDSTSTYNGQSDEESETEDTEVRTYTNRAFRSITPKYEVNIDFDEASAAWRSNKRRRGESWVYIKPRLTRSSSRNKHA